MDMRFGLTAATVMLSTLGLTGVVLAQAARPAAQPAASAVAPVSEAVARGDKLYTDLGCVACHGVAGQGGTNNAPDLTKSALAQISDGGMTLNAFLNVGRPERGMPPFPGLTTQQTSDLSDKLHAFAAAQAAQAARTGGGLPAALAGTTLSILVGDPSYGRTFFNGPVGKCSTCHAVQEGQQSRAANLAHIASKSKTEKDLQAHWLLPREQAWSPRDDNTVTAVATYADGRTVSGVLTSVSDFKLVIRDAGGAKTTIPIVKGDPKVKLVDKLQPHIDLLPTYQDNDIHNVTAYLATLK
jgi:cytochrome c oxidase cbb3-type subunit 3